MAGSYVPGAFLVYIKIKDSSEEKSEGLHAWFIFIQLQFLFIYFYTIISEMCCMLLFSASKTNVNPSVHLSLDRRSHSRHLGKLR